MHLIEPARLLLLALPIGLIGLTKEAGAKTHRRPGDLDPSRSRYFVVEICDRTGLSAGELDLACGQVSSIFKGAGIEILWLDCRQKSHFSPYEARVCIRNRLAERLEPDSHGMAYVLAETLKPPGPVIYVSRSSVEEFVGPKSKYLPILGRALGRVIAHELAHRFLQFRGHLDRGILRATYSRQELIDPRTCELYFTEEQRRFMLTYAPTAEALRRESPEIAPE